MAEKWAVLEISDGTDRIDLIYGPIRLKSWKPKVAQLKDGGVWGSSPFDSGKRLLDARNYDNVTEEFIISVGAGSQNAVITELQKLRRMLIKASQYESTKWQNSPVWIERRARKETNSTYSLVKMGYVPEDNEIFGSPFDDRRGRAVMPEISIFAEREPFWNSNKPGNSTGISITNQQTYNSIVFGRGETTSAEVFISNYHTQGNLSHVFRYDASGPTWSSNLIGAALPFSFLPTTPAGGDIVYFGNDGGAELTFAMPFDSLVFDISQAAANVTIVWEIYTGAWNALTVTDNTSGFSVLGVHSVHWAIPAGWVTTAINGVTAFWVRARVSGVGGGPVTPRQQNRDVYTVTTPFVKINTAQIGGDVSALSKIVLKNYADNLSFARLQSNEILMGLRSTSRGSNYTPYINFSDNGNISGITVTANPAPSVIATYGLCPTGRILRWTPTGIAGLTIQAFITFTGALLTEYIGTFHVFLRVRQTAGAAGNIGIQYQLNFGEMTTHYTSETKYTTQVSATNIEAIDFGLINFPGMNMNSIGSDTLSDLNFVIYLSNSNAANPPIELIDLVLFPVDEWSSDSVDPVLLATSGLEHDGTYYRQLDIDGITFPKNNRVSFLRRASTSARLADFKTITSSPPILQPNAQQKLWFFQRKYSSGWLSPFELSDIIQMYKTQRYLGMRGEN